MKVSNLGKTLNKVGVSSMNADEVESARKSDRVALDKGATAERMNLLLGMVSSKFGLDDSYSVTSFNDKGKVMNITLENSEFSLVITVKNSEQHGLFVE